MKNLFLFCFVASTFFYSSNAQEALENIEKNIAEAHSLSFETQTDHLKPLIEKLEASYKKSENQTVNYWIAFAQYKQASYYSNTGHKDLPLKILKEAINRLDKTANQTSEDLALQGTTLSFSITFRPQVAAIMSSKANTHYEKAIELNATNLRAYLGIGKSDFYRPEKYGGGDLVEKYLKLALIKPDRSNTEDYSPSWGRNEAYFYLASYYLRENRLSEAKLYYEQGLKLFPNDYRLKQLLKKLDE